jgi:hypothetical protein
MTKKVDIFPAIVFVAPPGLFENILDLDPTAGKPHGVRKVDRSRVVILDGKILVVVDSPEGPRLVFREAITEYIKNDSANSYHAVTESGKVLAFTKDRNCGCGSRLRSWSPFGNYLSASGDGDE